MQNKPLLIGVTGGIGAGKSLICKIFEVLGHKVYYADDRAKRLMQSDPSLKDSIKNLFGEEAYKDDQLNRSLIAEKVFKDPLILARLNAEVHPAVAKDLGRWVQEHHQEQILFDEAALLFETGTYKKMDATVLVVAPKEVRIERVLSRDSQRSRESIEDIIDKQMSEDKQIPLADFILKNDGKSSVIQGTMEVYQKLLSLHR